MESSEREGGAGLHPAGHAGLEAALGRATAEAERLRCKVVEQDTRMATVRAVLMDGLAELGVAAGDGTQNGDGGNGDAVVSDADLRGLRVEDVAKLVVDIAVSLNSDDASQQPGKEAEEEDDNERGDVEALKLQLARADGEISRLRDARDLEVVTTTSRDEGGGASAADLDELYRREATLAGQLAELKQRLGSAQHEAIVEIKRRQKLERDWEAEWAARQRLEKKVLSVRRRYEAARSQFVNETALRENQLNHLKKVRHGERGSMLGGGGGVERITHTRSRPKWPTWGCREERY